MLQRFVVPNPAAGVDWQWTVPGEYVATLISVTAQLLATANPTTATDATVNANNGTYSGLSNIVYGVTGPFGGGGGLAAQETVFATDMWLASNANAAGQYDLGTYSVDALVNFANTGSVNMNTIAAVRTGDLVHPADLRFLFGVSAPGGGLKIANTQAHVFGLGLSVGANVWAHVGFSYDGAQWIGYLNGVAGAPVAGFPPGVVTQKPFSIGGDLISPQNFPGKLAAVAFYAGALPAANFAAHNAAVATSAAAYKAAVLADAPVSLWMLDETQTHFQRTVALAITDGTTEVARFPGFTPTQQSPLFTYTWSVDGSGATQTPGQQVTVVPITPTTLPPGYTVGTRTLDLTALDQWENIVVWADVLPSDGGAGGGGDTGNVGYLDALILPEGWTGPIT